MCEKLVIDIAEVARQDPQSFTTVMGPRASVIRFLNRLPSFAAYERYDLSAWEARLIDLAELDGSVGELFRRDEAPAVGVVTHSADARFCVAADLQAELMVGPAAGDVDPMPELLCEPGFRFAGAASGVLPTLDPAKVTQVVASAPAIAATDKAAGRRVALLDTGLLTTSHPMIDFVDSFKLGVRSLSGDDPHGHGTAVAEILLATQPAADIRAVRVLNDQNRGASYEVFAGLEYAFWSGQFDIVNASLTTDTSGLCETSLGRSVDYLYSYCRANASFPVPMIVAAAGNDGPKKSSGYPANLRGAVVAQAIDANNVPENYNSTLPPNSIVRSAFGGSDRDQLGYTQPPNQAAQPLWGTSFAAAAVTGAYLP